MEGELFNVIQKPGEPSVAPQFAKQFPEISFIPPAVKEETTPSPKGMPEKCAIIGIALGALAIVSWIVIAIGVFAAIVGIVFSVLGLKSAHPKWARAGLTLSIIGLIASLWYVFAAYNGSVNYNYFTSEFWEATSGVEKGIK